MFTRWVEGLDWGADAPGFSGWGENRAKDFVLLGAGLSLSLDFSAEHRSTSVTGRCAQKVEVAYSRYGSRKFLA